MTPNLCYWTVAQTGRVVPLCEGIPGVAKTKSVEAFARALDRPCYTLIGSIREPGDVGGYPSVVKLDDAVTDPISGRRIDVSMSLVAPQWAMDCWDGRPWIIFIDELTTCPPAVQAALLAVIAEKRVGDLPLPEGTWILAACNPAGVAANGFELEPPMANRLCHLPWVIDKALWRRGMANGMKFDEPRFTALPDDWEANHAASAGTRVAAFLEHRPDLVEAYPERNRADAAKAWPSPRSWTNAAWCAAACDAVGGPPELRYQAIEGCVGYAASHEYETWEKALDLPDPEVLLTSAIHAREANRPVDWTPPVRADHVMVIMGAVADRVLNHGNTGKRWCAAGSLFERVAECRGPELAAVQVSALFRDVPVGGELDDAFVERLHGLFARVGMIA